MSGDRQTNVYSKTPKQIEAMWNAYQSAPDETTVADLRAIMERAASNVGTAAESALIEKLEEINRNILAEASRIGDVDSSSYASLLGEAAGVRMALRFVREAAEACACEWNPACPEHGVTG